MNLLMKSYIIVSTSKEKLFEKESNFDFGDRLLLNFGHTYAHAIEQYYHYENILMGKP